MCTDLDEYFRPGWRKALERAWTAGTEQLRYTYIWNFDEAGRPGTSFLYEKIHAPGVFEWEHPVHEVLRATDGKKAWKVSACPEIVLEHHPDLTKSRAGYLPLLELSVREAPEDDRNAHYLGREYMFWGRWDEAIAQLKAHLQMPTAHLGAGAVRLHALSLPLLSQQGGQAGGHALALRAIAECPETREPWVQAEEVAYAMENWYGVYSFGSRALEIKEKSGTYINEDKAGRPTRGTPWRMRSIRWG